MAAVKGGLSIHKAVLEGMWSITRPLAQLYLTDGYPHITGQQGLVRSLLSEDSKLINAKDDVGQSDFSQSSFP